MIKLLSVYHGGRQKSYIPVFTEMQLLTWQGQPILRTQQNRIKAQPAAGGFDSERRSSGVSARWLLMQSIKKPSQAIQSLRRRWCERGDLNPRCGAGPPRVETCHRHVSKSPREFKSPCKKRTLRPFGRTVLFWQGQPILRTDELSLIVSRRRLFCVLYTNS